MAQLEYYAQKNQQNTLKLREILLELPAFCQDFFRSIQNTTGSLTRLNYAYDLRLFFNYAAKNIFKKPVLEITLSDLDKINSIDIEMFIDHIRLYSNDNNENYVENNERGIARKIASLRSFFKCFFKKGLISANVAALVDMPKIHQGTITRLEVDEVVKLLDTVEQGNELSKTQKRYHEITVKRDLAMLTLFLGTGIRISECIGLNLSDIDFENYSFNVTRKGGNIVTLFFNDEIAEPLLDYIEQRILIKDTSEQDEEALFLSMQHKRITARAVQNIVKKYSQIVTPLKHITPHKLRSTYGTTLYRETGDIYLVAEVLGHKDVNTTKKHYAAMSEDRRRMASKVVKLRDED